MAWTTEFDVFSGAENKSTVYWSKKKMLNPIGQKHEGTHSARRRRDINKLVAAMARFLT